MLRFTKLGCLSFALTVSSAFAVDITVQSSGGNATSGHQYGFLHEDINYSGEGGIYAELIRNRAFQSSPNYPVTLKWWLPVNSASLSLQKLSTPLSAALPHSVRVTSSGSSRPAGLANEGYFGMDVKRKKYTGSFWVKGAYHGAFTASLQSNLTGEVFGSVEVPSKSRDDTWIEHEFELVPEKDAPNSNNTFAITFDAAGTKGGTLDFNLISLFPPTYKGRKNGLRVDLAEALEQIHPTFFRFPGGNMLEGVNNASYWDWKKSLGPLKDRPGFTGTWGYMQTYGLGLMEYLYWAEDMGMEVVIGVFAGLSLNGDITPKDKLQPFIDDALNQIEFIRGPVTSPWGARRAELGHPEPFALKFVEVGNEDWLAGGTPGWQSYMEYRFPMFLEAINKAYPDITVIGSGSTSDGYQVPRGTGDSPAMGDYHPYRQPDQLYDEFDKFDNNPIPHIVGEVAATHLNGRIGWGDLNYFPWWIGSVGEAISMIGYERNCDRVRGTFYAPSMRHMDSWAWAVTLIQYSADPALTTRSTSWYIWELLAGHPLTHTLPASSNFDPLFYVAGTNAAKGPGSRIWKGAVYNTTDHADVSVSVKFEGVSAGTKAVLRRLTGPSDPFMWNDPHTGVNVVNSSSTILTAGAAGKFEFVMQELSVAVLDTDVDTPRGKKEISVETTLYS